MDDVDIVCAMKKIGTVISKMLGPSTEVVIHELDTGKIIFIENGYITGRKEGDRSDKNTLDAFFQHMGKNGYLANYSGSTKFHKPLRSSTVQIKDKSGKPTYIFCINQDIAALQSARDILNSLTTVNPLSVDIDDKTDTIQEITNKLIIEEIEKMKPLSLDSKDAKLEIIKKLDARGIFNVKDAVPQICKILSISQATLYNYQREIRVANANK